MKTGKVIIGANYGDEGKGLLTDYFASQHPEDSLVVRFNGGAQAGHTVIAPDGRRHIFSHFGSGTLAGAPTFLSKFFIVNPLIFLKEFSELLQTGVSPQIRIDANAMLTTPFDMFINQTIENRRGKMRHGSCGLGINESVTRSMRAPHLRLAASDMLSAKTLRRKLYALKESWFNPRLTELHLDPDCAEVQNFLNHIDCILDKFVADSQTVAAIAAISKHYPDARIIIFEGAQGLMLDEDRIDQFPHVTRSKTGLTNVIHLAPGFGIDRLDVTYISRTYLTRHGAGPLDGECDWKFPDSTNIPNQFQGQLRFAPLVLQTLNENIQHDLRRAQGKLKLSADVAMTCADQVPLPPDTAALSLPVNYFSYGPTRSDIARALTCSMR
ncbi:MAG TPA: adenylosuccinate synthetase [Drouetiella sp.]|jgi:adenylosuccinate synthase